MGCCLDPRCKRNPLVRAMEEVLGIEIFCGCRGHVAGSKFEIWFRQATIDSVLWLAEEAHSAGGWFCGVAPNCHGLFLLKSFAEGDEAYRQADKIARGLRSKGSVRLLTKRRQKLTAQSQPNPFSGTPDTKRNVLRSSGR